LTATSQRIRHLHDIELTVLGALRLHTLQGDGLLDEALPGRYLYHVVRNHPARTSTTV